ncbi:MAG: hypothetical protein WD267_12275 [Balneolales bacterium]
MHFLNMDMFTQTEEDFEIRQYKILHGLKLTYDYFSRNRLYPLLGEMVTLYRDLQNTLKKIQQLQDDFPKKIKEIDWKKKDIIYEKVYQDEGNIGPIVDIIEWALPQIKKTIDEGVAIFEFVDQNLEVEKVGIIPSYLEEGYVFVPDNSKKRLNLFRYEVSIYASPEDTHRALKTTNIRTISIDNLYPTSNSIKLKLINYHKDLPNPATYSFHTSLDFPFQETIFPIAKRKLMRYLYS